MDSPTLTALLKQLDPADDVGRLMLADEFDLAERHLEAKLLRAVHVPIHVLDDGVRVHFGLIASATPPISSPPDRLATGDVALCIPNLFPSTGARISVFLKQTSVTANIDFPADGVWASSRGLLLSVTEQEQVFHWFAGEVTDYYRKRVRESHEHLMERFVQASPAGL